jgi:alpha-galactosidase
MAKIVLIGAGGFGWTRTLVTDLLTYPALRDGEIALVDIHAGRLRAAMKICEKLITAAGTKTKLTASVERRDVLKGADAVVITILCGSTEVWQHDILIPKKYGIDINVGDTRGVSGIFRALRTIPTMVDICRDVEKLCPKALVLNYTNPMAMVCDAMQRQTNVTVTGLCHSVQGTAHMLADWCGAPPAEVSYTCAGINHLSWFLTLEHNGKDLYPTLREKVLRSRKIRNHEQVRNEMFLAMGYYVTESSGHNSEYNAWFRKRPDLIERYCTHGTGWNPGEYAYILKEYRRREKTWQKTELAWLSKKEPIRIARSNEYATGIINAWLGEGAYTFNGNVPNAGIVTNLPDYCVEVPVLVRRRQLQAMRVGPLPDQVMPLTANHAYSEKMAVEAALTGNPELVYQSILNDPLTAAVLSLAEIRKMTAEMLRKNQPHLRAFKSVAI